MSSVEIHIEATDTDPVVQARTALHDAQRRLLERVDTAPPGQASGSGAAAEEVRRHLQAADDALYAPASGAPRTLLLVRALRASAAALARQCDGSSRTARTDAGTAPSAEGLRAALDLHFAIEREVLLPALAELPGADLPYHVADLHTLLDGGRLEQPEVLDVREIPHGRRHPRIFARFSRLAAGEAFTLVNNHDPKPLRREFEAAHPGAFSWDYVESGPERWQVRIGRVPADA